MNDSLYLACRYMIYHKIKTTLLVTSITLIFFLPAGLNVLVDESSAKLRFRADQTPLIIGARGSELELALNTLYFESKTPDNMKFSELTQVHESKLATPIPLYTRFRARQMPIVATTLDYFLFRKLKVAEGRQLASLGECILGSSVASQLQLKSGESIVSTPENAFDLAGNYPLKMKIVGILQPSESPDDSAIFVDLKTAWIIAGLCHGHQNLSQPESSKYLLSQNESTLTANAAVMQYREVTPENRESFHFHGDVSNYPISSIIAVPRNEKSLTILMGRYLNSDNIIQAVRPAKVINELLSTVLRIRSFMIAGTLLVGISTLLTSLLVFLLSLRLRRVEIITMRKIGATRLRVFSILAWEIVIVLGISVVSATLLTQLTRRYGDIFIRWFLL